MTIGGNAMLFAAGMPPRASSVDATWAMRCSGPVRPRAAMPLPHSRYTPEIGRATRPELQSRQYLVCRLLLEKKLHVSVEVDYRRLDAVDPLRGLPALPLEQPAAEACHDDDAHQREPRHPRYIGVSHV